MCEDFPYWQRSIGSPGRISVNLSLKQLRQPNFISRISAILRSYEVSPTSLELEITETTLMENPERTIKLLDQLYALGLHLAIDDFGTGYSSFSYLHSFPFDTLKIDRVFVSAMLRNKKSNQIVKSLVNLSHNLGMDVVAEGIESDREAELMRQYGTRYGQGYYFSRAVTESEFIELLQRPTINPVA